jgi:hypothetical protein
MVGGAVGELIDFGRRIGRITEPGQLKRISLAAGMAGKKASIAVAAGDLGGDLTFSGMGRKVRLGVGFDVVGPTSIKLKYRPPGLWILADTGRRGGYPIRPRRRLGGAGSEHAPALRTPDGWRAAAVGGRWGGKGTLKSAIRVSRIAVPRAAFKQFQVEVRRIVR